MSYYTDQVLVHGNVPTLLVDEQDTDTFIYLDTSTVALGFSSTTCYITYTFIIGNSSGVGASGFVLPAGTQLWGARSSDTTVNLMVTKSPSSLKLCG